jgi:TonB family protein
MPVVDSDRVETGGDGAATIALKTLDELKLGAHAAVSFEVWDERDPNSPVYVHVLHGEVESKAGGVRGRAYLVREGRLYAPGQKPGVKQPPLLITRSTAGRDEAKTAAPSPALPESTATRDDLDTPATATTARDPETLANEYVEEMISSRGSLLQKCWLSRLKDKPKLKGKLTVQFEINRRGKVREASIVDSSLNDEQLGQCVATVIERIPFRGFTGPEISIAYPISFE